VYTAWHPATTCGRLGPWPSWTTSLGNRLRVNVYTCTC